METRLYRVEGRVQGVGFRWWTRSLARRCGLSGWVRNRADGTVELLATGPAAALQRLRDALGSGPPGAEVRRVQEREGGEPASGEFRILTE